MGKTAEFLIKINGINESITAIEDLNKRLESLETKINSLQNKSINITANSSGFDKMSSSRVSALSEEEKLTRQILQLDEKREVYQKELYQSYLASKDLMKETLQDQKQLAAAQRLSNDQYTNTMAGMKQQLSDIKAVMQTVDLSDTGQMDKLTQKANELTEKLKEIEQSYGQFGRNVGNYANGVKEGIDKALGGIEITIDGTTKRFDSLRQATVSIKNELGTLEYQGKQNTKQYKDLTNELEKLQKAQLRLNSAMNDAKASSKGMDNMLDMMQSFVAINQTTRGLSSLFGVDTSKIQESIQKLLALQNALQGIEKIRQQLNTNEGIGMVFNRANASINAMNMSLKRTIVSLMGTGTAARAAAVGVNMLSAGLKALGIGLIIGAITLLVEGISKVSKSIQGWVKGNADLVSSEKLMKSALEQTNDELRRNLELLEKKHNAGIISRLQMQAQSEEAYANAIMEANKQLEKQLELSSKKGENKAFANSALGNQSIIGDAGVTTFGGIGHRGIDESIKSMDEAIKRWKLLTEAVEKGVGVTQSANSEFGRMSLTASDAKDELNHMEQVIAGELIRSMRQFDLSTQDGRRAMADFVKNIEKNGNEMQKSVLFRIGEILGSKKPELANALNGYLNIVNQFVNEFNSETQKMNAMNMVNSIIKGADPNSALKDKLAELTEMAKNEGQKYTIAEVGQINEAIAIVQKQMRDNSNKKIKTIQTNAKKERDEVENTQRRINELTISLMRDGMLKELRQLDEQNRQEILKIQQNGKRVEEQLALQQRKYQQDRKKIFDEYENQLKEANVEIDFKINDTGIEKLELQLGYLKQIALDLPLLIDGQTFKNDMKDLAATLGVELKKVNGQLVITQELKEKLSEPMEFYALGTDAHVRGNVEGFYKFLLNFMETLDAETREKVLNIYDDSLDKYKETLKNEEEAMKKAQERMFYELEELYFSAHSNELRFIEKYELNPINALFGGESDMKLLELSSDSITEAIDYFRESTIKQMLDAIDAIKEARMKALDKQKDEEGREIGKSLFEGLLGLSGLTEEDKRMFEEFDYDIVKYTHSIQKKLENLKAAFDSGELDEKNYEMNKAFYKDMSTIVTEYKEKITSELEELNMKDLNGVISKEDYEEEKQLLEQRFGTFELFEKRINELATRYSNERTKILRESQENQSKIVDDFYQTVVNSLRERLSKINNMTSKDNYVNNGFGLIDVKKTKKNFDEALKQIDEFRKELKARMDELTEEFGNNNISPETYGRRRGELFALLSIANQSYEQVENNSKDVEKENKKKKAALVAIWGDAIVDVMNSIGQIQDAVFQKQMDALDKYNDELEKKLQKQKEITERYSNDIDDIENELENSRGDRRQYLIDKLNQQMQAQRESLIQEQEIQKEQEKLDKRKEKLEEENNKRKKLQAITTAIINAALAISNAAVNFWPEPAKTMIAAAAVTTAAQIAAIRAAKYEKGGLLEGKSHKQGGIPVGNTGIEVEGKEYIIRKESTTPNIELLDYINKSKRKLDLDDFIDFYSSKRIGSSIERTKPKYATGGQVPTLRTDINTNTRMVTAMEAYSNRPVIVSIVDIVNKAENLKHTQVMAGLNPNSI